MTLSRFDALGAIVSILSVVQLFLSLLVVQAMQFAQPQVVIVAVCFTGTLVIGLASILQAQNDHRFLYERRALLLLYYAITFERFFIYGCEAPCDVCVLLGLPRLIVAYLEAILAVPLYVLAIRQQSRNAAPPALEQEIELHAPTVRQRIVQDTAEDSMHTVALGSHKNE